MVMGDYFRQTRRMVATNVLHCIYVARKGRTLRITTIKSRSFSRHGGDMCPISGGLTLLVETQQ